MDKIVLKNDYIDACDLNKVSKSTQKLILESWIYKKNKHTQKNIMLNRHPLGMNDDLQKKYSF